VKDTSPQKKYIPSSPVNSFEVLEIQECEKDDEIVSEGTTIPKLTLEIYRNKEKTNQKPDMKEWTPEWIKWHMDNKPMKGLQILTTWTHRKRKSEISEELMVKLLQLQEVDCLEAIAELRKSPQWIQKIDQSSVMIPVVVETIDNRRGFTIGALLDSGATGCYIDEGFTKSKLLNMNQLPRPILVYNANGTHNGGGPIEYTVDLRLCKRSPSYTHSKATATLSHWPYATRPCGIFLI
jgi:hypothetical protein